MSASNELNDLVNFGKEDIKKFVRIYIHLSLSAGNEEEKRAAMTVSSLLTLSVKKTAPDIDITHIRTLIIEENLAVLAELPDHDPRVLRLFALATGRVAQAREYMAALLRVGQTYLDDAGAIARYMGKLEAALHTIERASVKIFRNEDGKPVLLDLGNLLEKAQNGGIVPDKSETLLPLH